MVPLALLGLPFYLKLIKTLATYAMTGVKSCEKQYDLHIKAFEMSKLSLGSKMITVPLTVDITNILDDGISIRNNYEEDSDEYSYIDFDINYNELERIIATTLKEFVLE